MKKMVIVLLTCMSVSQVRCQDTKKTISEKDLYRKYGKGHLSMYVAEKIDDGLSDYKLQDVIKNIKYYLRPEVIERYMQSYQLVYTNSVELCKAIYLSETPKIPIINYFYEKEGKRGFNTLVLVPIEKFEELFERVSQSYENKNCRRFNFCGKEFIYFLDPTGSVEIWKTRKSKSEFLSRCSQNITSRSAYITNTGYMVKCDGSIAKIVKKENSTSECVHTLKANADITSCIYRPDYNLIVLGTKNGTIKAFKPTICHEEVMQGSLRDIAKVIHGSERKK